MHILTGQDLRCHILDELAGQRLFLPPIIIIKCSFLNQGQAHIRKGREQGSWAHAPSTLLLLQPSCRRSLELGQALLCGLELLLFRRHRRQGLLQLLVQPCCRRLVICCAGAAVGSGGRHACWGSRCACSSAGGTGGCRRRPGGGGHGEGHAGHAREAGLDDAAHLCLLRGAAAQQLRGAVALQGAGPRGTWLACRRCDLPALLPHRAPQAVAQRSCSPEQRSEVWSVGIQA